MEEKPNVGGRKKQQAAAKKAINNYIWDTVQPKIRENEAMFELGENG